jgi:hypothetical protein
LKENLKNNLRDSRFLEVCLRFSSFSELTTSRFFFEVTSDFTVKSFVFQFRKKSKSIHLHNIVESELCTQFTINELNEWKKRERRKKLKSDNLFV